MVKGGPRGKIVTDRIFNGIAWGLSLLTLIYLGVHVLVALTK